MLYQMLTAATEWIEGPQNVAVQPLSAAKTDSSVPALALAGDAQQDVCKFYLQGKCKFGDKCRNLHSKVAKTSPTKGVAADTQVPAKSSKGKHLKAGSAGSEVQRGKDAQLAKPVKAKAQPHHKDTEDDVKKAPMRQATDVISRILWDPDLPTEEFTVGYLDRFVGVVEKPFSSFSWEDIASVGMNVLAVPKHRIQYFKYRDEIVWDKTVQLDNVFGSRGGKDISEILSTCTADSTSSSDDTLPPSEKSNLEFAEEMNEEEGPESDKRDKFSAMTADKNRPNHFVCVRVTDAAVKANVQQIQDHITGHTPQLAGGCMPTTALHVTLCMVRIENEAQAEVVKSVLQNTAKQLVHLLPPCLKLVFSGVGNFRERLVFVRVVPNPALTRFVLHLLDQLKQGGIRTPGNHEEYTPHMTIVKLTRPMQRELHTALISPAAYKLFEHMHVGLQSVDAIHACSMTAPKQADGFYVRIASITNSLANMSLQFPSLALNRLDFIASSGIITASERERIGQNIRDGSTTGTGSLLKFDDAIQELLELNSNETMCSRREPIGTTTVVILRGLPGSGKSFLAHNCSEMNKHPSTVNVCAADDFFVEGDSYKFSGDLLPKAHTHCLDAFLNALANRKELIIIDNTNSMLWEYQIYTYLCDILGCKCNILELPCPTAAIAEMYCSRNIHKIDSPTAAKIFSRWENDDRVALIPPSLGFPRFQPRPLPSFSLLKLSDPIATPTNEIDALSSLKAVYTAVVLTPDSQWQLVSTFPPTHPHIYASHITLCFDPSPQNLAIANVGHHISVKVTGSVDGGKVQAVIVSLPKGVASTNECPHITISAEDGISPKVSNEMLKSRSAKSSHRTQSLLLEGTIGVVLREANERDGAEGSSVVSNEPSYCVTSGADFHHHVLPRLFVPTSVDQKVSESIGSMVNASTVQICTGHQKVTQLFIFDFDGTLFDAPEPREGKELYEKVKGKQWPHKGWLGWPESLLPPMQIRPGPALPEFHEHLGRAGSLTIVLTGRVDRLDKTLRHVLESNRVFPQRLYLKPTAGSETTPQFKARVVHQLIEEFSDVTLVKFWDDIPNNLAAIQRVSRTLGPGVQCDIIDATKMIPTIASKQGKKLLIRNPLPGPSSPKGMSVLESYLASVGRLPNSTFKSAVVAGIQFLASQFCSVIDVPADCADNLSYPFGSYLLNRRSDVDLCLLAPPTFTPKDCLDKLSRRLESCAVHFVHAGHSSRCPRLKVVLEFADAPSVAYDVVFASITNKEVFSWPQANKLPASELLSAVVPGDSASKVALTGAVFLQEVLESINGILPVSQFGAVTEMLVYILTAHRQKGNAYHCMRTFHVVKLLASFLAAHKCELPRQPTCDDVFKAFVVHLSTLSESNLKDLFGEFVPNKFIPCLLKLFSRLNKEVSSEDYPSTNCCEEMSDRPPFPPEGYTLVELELSGSDAVLLWKLSSIIEARLPTYIRQLLEMGVDVSPDGNPSNERKFCFAVPRSKSNKETLQQILRPFWTELVKYRKDSDVRIELTFGISNDNPTPSDPVISEAHALTSTGVVIEQIAQFAASTSAGELHLPSSLTSYDRLLVHETAERFHLHHATVGSGKQKHIVLKKRDCN